MIKDGLSVEDKEVGSVLMIGQSNMAGRGDFGEVEEIDNNKCFMLRMGRWQKMSEPINPDRRVFGTGFHSGVSLAASFADSYAKYFNKPIGLIPCADGGTKICQWMPGTVLFDNAIMHTKLAMRTSKLKAIILHQGESDCKLMSDVIAYKDLFITMISALRRELNAGNIPLIIGEISEEITEAWDVGSRPKTFNKILHNIAEEIPCCSIASSAGLTLKNDGIHFCSVSCREMGKRYFECYKALSQNMKE